MRRVNAIKTKSAAPSTSPCSASKRSPANASATAETAHNVMKAASAIPGRETYERVLFSGLKLRSTVKLGKLDAHAGVGRIESRAKGAPSAAMRFERLRRRADEIPSVE